MSEVLRVTEIPRSSWYASGQKKAARLPSPGKKRGRPVPGSTRNPDGTIVPDAMIVKAIKDYRERPEFQNAAGVDKLAHYLRRDHGFYVNRKKIYRLCRENALLLPRTRKRWKRKGGFISKNHEVDRPNRLWEFDIKYGYIHGEHRFFFLLAFTDVFTRKCVGRYVGRTCRKGDLCFTLRQALEAEGVTSEDGLTIRSDNGPQMRSNQFHHYLEKLESRLSHEFTPVKSPNKNAHVESFFSIIESDFLQVRYFHSFAEAYRETHEFIDFYNEERIHGSLGMRTPEEVKELWKGGYETGIKSVHL